MVKFCDMEYATWTRIQTVGILLAALAVVVVAATAAAPKRKWWVQPASVVEDGVAFHGAVFDLEDQYTGRIYLGVAVEEDGKQTVYGAVARVERGHGSVELPETVARRLSEGTARIVWSRVGDDIRPERKEH